MEDIYTRFIGKYTLQQLLFFIEMPSLACLVDDHICRDKPTSPYFKIIYGDSKIVGDIQPESNGNTLPIIYAVQKST